MDKNEVQDFLFDEQSKCYVEKFHKDTNGFITTFTVFTNDSSVLAYLNDNGAKVVYSDTDGLILLKY
ncbi:MAG: hypothetical protein WC677_07665 [Clostridia bacterium]|jgi:hypothetical protein